jgi:hypothetical protein
MDNRVGRIRWPQAKGQSVVIAEGPSFQRRGKRVTGMGQGGQGRLNLLVFGG